MATTTIDNADTLYKSTRKAKVLQKELILFFDKYMYEYVNIDYLEDEDDPNSRKDVTDFITEVEITSAITGANVNITMQSKEIVSFFIENDYGNTYPFSIAIVRKNDILDNVLIIADEKSNTPYYIINMFDKNSRKQVEYIMKCPTTLVIPANKEYVEVNDLDEGTCENPYLVIRGGKYPEILNGAEDIPLACFSIEEAKDIVSKDMARKKNNYLISTFLSTFPEPSHMAFPYIFENGYEACNYLRFSNNYPFYRKIRLNVDGIDHLYFTDLVVNGKYNIHEGVNPLHEK